MQGKKARSKLGLSVKDNFQLNTPRIVHFNEIFPSSVGEKNHRLGIFLYGKNNCKTS